MLFVYSLYNTNLW